MSSSRVCMGAPAHFAAPAARNLAATRQRQSRSAHSRCATAELTRCTDAPVATRTMDAATATSPSRPTAHTATSSPSAKHCCVSLATAGCCTKAAQAEQHKQAAQTEAAQRSRPAWQHSTKATWARQHRSRPRRQTAVLCHEAAAGQAARGRPRAVSRRTRCRVHCGRPAAAGAALPQSLVRRGCR